MDAVVLTAEQIAAMPWQEMPSFEKVTNRLLWRSGASEAGIMRIEAGGDVPDHAHRAAHHHVWVIEGTVIILGQKLSAGSYVHVPAGVDHEMLPGAEGCTLLYTYLREPLA